MNRDNQFTLSDGRKLAYIEYGDLTGFPIFALHGLPGSRIWFEENDEISHSMGIRLITIDRPGFGNSDQKKDRDFIDFSNDLRELTLYLKIKKFSVLGVSGGGVYAAACAYSNSQSIFKCGLISTVGQFKNGKPPKDMASENKNVFLLSRKFPWLLKLMLNQQKTFMDKKPAKYKFAIMSNTKHLCRSDRLIMEKEENAEFMLIHMKEAFKKGVKSTINEAKLFCKDWGFNVNQIEVPTEIWHGTEDTLSPISAIRELADKFQNCNKNFVDGKGHFLTEEESIWKEILMSLKE